jgi:outer membrane protein assembly factor BamB
MVITVRPGPPQWMVCLVLVGFLAGCGGSTPRSAGSTPAVAATGPAASWKRSDIRPVTQPAAVADRLLVYAATRGGLRVLALNARTGATVWSDYGSPSLNAPGQPAQLALVDGAVVYLRAVSGQAAELVAADPATGREFWHTAVGGFSSWPTPCVEDVTNVCTTGFLVSDRGPMSQLRFNGRTGALLPSAAVSSEVGRAIGSGLFDPGTRDPAELVAATGSAVTWRLPLASIFTRKHASTDYGWNIDRITRLGLFVGSVGATPIVQTKTRVEIDLAAVMTAAFRISDGTAVWRADGASYACNLLPCVGSTLAGFASQATEAAGPTVGVLLHESGTASGSPTGAALPTVSQNARVSLLGFDPATGRILWRFAAGHDRDLLGLRRLPPQIAANTVVLADARGGLITLNLANGARAATTPSRRAWCRAPLTYTESVPYTANNGLSTTHYIGQFGLYPCTTTAVRRPQPTRIPNFVGAIGAEADGLVAWSDSTGVTAARLTQ